jgi:hypothetical protein
MPAPNKGETKDAYLHRCMGDKEMNEKHPHSDQRYAICNSLWEHHGDAKSRAGITANDLKKLGMV